MEILTPQGDLEGFFVRLGNSSRPVLLTDYDGTLAPFQTDPAKAVPYPGVRELLSEIRQGRSRLVVISGRSIDDLRPLLKLDGVEIWGSHGRERLTPDGGRWEAPMSAKARTAMARAEQMIREEGLGDRCELKPGCIAVHHRGLDRAAVEGVEQAVSRIYSAVGAKAELELKRFDGGLEFRVPGVSKGVVIRRLLDEGDHGGAVTAYLGDDRTDEDAFEELEGHGLRVLVRPECRPTLADLWLSPPEELLGFLERWKTAVEGNRA